MEVLNIRGWEKHLTVDLAAKQESIGIEPQQ